MALDEHDRNEIRLMILGELDSILREVKFNQFRDLTLNRVADEIHKSLFDEIVKREKEAHNRKEQMTQAKSVDDRINKEF